jgi:hypothetical protein
VLGNFPALSEGRLFSLAACEAASERSLDPEDDQPIEIGVDLAAAGGDECVLFARQGRSVIHAEYWRDPDTMKSAGRIAACCRTLSASLVKVDDIGIGKGAVDHLHHALSAERTVVVGVNVGAKAFDSERFYNKRGELFWSLADRFKAGEISIPKADDMLIDQLTQLKYEFTPRGQIKLESKEDLKKERPSASRWHSPDRADALALCFAPSPNRWAPVDLSAPVYAPDW